MCAAFSRGIFFASKMWGAENIVLVQILSNECGRFLIAPMCPCCLYIAISEISCQNGARGCITFLLPKIYWHFSKLSFYTLEWQKCECFHLLGMFLIFLLHKILPRIYVLKLSLYMVGVSANGVWLLHQNKERLCDFIFCFATFNVPLIFFFFEVVAAAVSFPFRRRFHGEIY